MPPHESINIIINDMDYNRMSVPKIKMTMKRDRILIYVKTHLSRVLVHGIGLYCYVWIHVHYKYDSNQSTKSVMKGVARC